MLNKTPLNSIHRQLGAKMSVFAGWEMSVHYAGPLQEHMAFRTRAGIFDISHMGEIEAKDQTRRQRFISLPATAVTGSRAPFLKKNIGLVYLPIERSSGLGI
jgi:glycine cleavage system aminomethyltransferase T